MTFLHSMTRTRLAAVVASSVLAALTVFVTRDGAATAGEARGADGGISIEQFDALRPQLRLKAQPWATVSWKVSVSDAREAAAKSRKPIFLVVNTGNCLGFV